MTVDSPSTPEDTPLSSLKYLRPRVIIWSSVAFLGISIVALLVVPQLLLDYYLKNMKINGTSLRLLIGSTTQVVLFSLGGFIALVGVVLSLSRHRIELETSQHDRLKEDRRVSELGQQRRIDAERELRTRFTQAVALLSDPDKPTTRLAGVYALGALADDWINHGRLDERQVCIDVICGYLRSKWDPMADHADDERRIRTAAFELVGVHLRAGADRPSWDGADFNISGALIDFDFDFSGVTVATSRISFEDTTVRRGTVNFSDATLSGGEVIFKRTTVSEGTIDFRGAALSDGAVNFIGATLSGGEVTFAGATLSGGTVNFGGAKLSLGEVNFFGAKLSGGTVNFRGAKLSEGTVNFRGAMFSNGEVTFRGATIRRGEVNFSRATLLGGEVNFTSSTLSDAEVDFTDATLSDGTVSFGRAKPSGSKIDFSAARFLDGTVITFNGKDFRDHPIVML